MPLAHAYCRPDGSTGGYGATGLSHLIQSVPAFLPASSIDCAQELPGYVHTASPDALTCECNAGLKGLWRQAASSGVTQRTKRFGEKSVAWPPGLRPRPQIAVAWRREWSEIQCLDCPAPFGVCRVLSVGIAAHLSQLAGRVQDRDSQFVRVASNPGGTRC